MGATTDNLKQFDDQVTAFDVTLTVNPGDPPQMSYEMHAKHWMKKWDDAIAADAKRVCEFIDAEGLRLAKEGGRR